jgi:proteasome assembly chaperone (PAC2) family protein
LLACLCDDLRVSSPLQFHGEPDLRAPTLVLAYAGWNDGGESATTAVRYLLGQLDAGRLARIDTDEFLDFTVARPHARPHDGYAREIVWPDHEFFAVRNHGAEGDLIFGLGVEPHLRWKAYCRTLCELVRTTRTRKVVLLGAFLADVIYSQPIQVRGFSTDRGLSRELGFGPSTYEGPTGIVGVLLDALRQEGVPAISLWASLPHYVSLTPNARGALALVQALSEISEIRVQLSGLEASAAEFDETVSELIASDPQLTAYVRELKRRAFSQ